MPDYQVEVGPDIVDPTHHLSLIAEDGQEVGFILCDATGKRLPYAVARANLQTLPIKTASGDSQYSDQELPFFTAAQQDWSGGGGQERFEDNRTKYAVGRRVQTVNGKMVLGPREHFTEGYRPQVISWPTPGVEGAMEGDIGRLKWTQAQDPNAMGYKFHTRDNYTITAGSLMLFGKTIGSANGPDPDTDHAHLIHWQIWEGDGDFPGDGGAMLEEGIAQIPATEDSIMRWHQAEILSGPDLPTLDPDTDYWIVFYPNENADDDNHIELGFWHNTFDERGYYTQTTVLSDDVGATWGSAQTDYQPIFRIENSRAEWSVNTRGWFVPYRQQLYYLTRPYTGPPELWMNGWRGVCDSNTGNTGKLLDAAQTGTGWEDNGARDTIVWVFAGPGSEEKIPFRLVTASADGELTVQTNWNIEHTEDTEYVVLGSQLWFEITHTIPEPPTGRPAVATGSETPPDGPPISTNCIMYIPQGHADVATPIWLFRQVNVAGVLTTESKSINDGTGGAGNYQTKLIMTVQDQTLGPILVKIEDNNATGLAGILAEARKPGSWTSQLAWGGDESLGDSAPSALINRIEFVDESERRVAWATSREEIFAREGGEIPGIWRSVLLPELFAFASENTGRALAVFNAALYLTLTGGLLERLQGNTLIDVGPGKGLGYPWSRAGEIATLVAYPGQLFSCVAQLVEGSTDRYSTIFRMIGLDSHDPIYEGGSGRLITDMIAQRLPNAQGTPQGANSRLWFAEGDDLMWVDLPNQGTNPLSDVNYQFAAEGFVSSSRITTGLDDRLKVYSSVKVVSDDLLGDTGIGRPEATRWVEPEYLLDQGDNDNDGQVYANAYGGIITESPSQEIFLTNYDNDQVVPVRGRYLKMRLKLNSTDGFGSPVVRAQLIEALISIPNKFSFKGTVLFEDNQIDLRGQPVPDDHAWEQIGKLQEYSERLEVFTLHAISNTLHGAKVIIATPEVSPIAQSKDATSTERQESEERLIGSIPFIQVILPDLSALLE